MRALHAVVVLVTACGGESRSKDSDASLLDTGMPDSAAQADVTTPFPIDRGGIAGGPSTYKGLPLVLTDNGSPAVTAVRGVIGVVCVGMSNATQECSDYIAKLSSTLAGQVDAEVRVVDCAVGGHAIERWNDPAYDGTLWDSCVNQKIGARGVAVDQVRVVYHKAANQFTSNTNGSAKPTYPDPAADYFAFETNLGTFAQRLAQKLPAVQAVYTTSRSYGGFATDQARRGEPLSYEEGHALNQWLAKNKLIGNVWYGWGPYIWAPACGSGVNGSNTCYVREDYVQDGVHPAPGARDKITSMIHARFSRESWYTP